MRYTPAQLIDAKGGPTTVARALGMRPGTVQLWKHRNKIPRNAWPELVRAFPDLNLDKLVAVERRAA